MKKVVYSVTRLSKNNKFKVAGFGYVTKDDLITAQTSTSGSAYVRVYPECVKQCFPVTGKDDEFTGKYTEYVEKEIEREDGSFDTRDIEVHYSVWFKFV